IKVTRGSKTQVCFVGGHGEPDIDDQQSAKGFAVWKEALESQNYVVKKIVLANVDKVPDDCNVTIASGTDKAFLENEITALGNYLKAGGHLLLMLPPQEGQELKPLLAEWGVAAGDDVVLDQQMRIFQGPSIGVEPLANTYGKHEITEQIRDFTLFPMTRSISAGETKPQLQVTELVKTGESSWAEADLEGVFKLGRVKRDAPGNKQGPVSVAVAVEAKMKQSEGTPLARLVVFGSNELASNSKIAGGSTYNRELLLNVVGWL